MKTILCDFLTCMEEPIDIKQVLANKESADVAGLIISADGYVSTNLRLWFGRLTMLFPLKAAPNMFNKKSIIY